eukprot:TRINITY_DN709_c0_g1_i3.p2 TRINITY_DN709_c0_g1~~TRINITY_DN709_c0_g1_i3.p2  ORF type:complete len:238 (-),score=63.51 TRINITY_DN709_c0_g1_i3:73-786(-)
MATIAVNAPCLDTEMHLRSPPRAPVKSDYDMAADLTNAATAPPSPGSFLVDWEPSPGSFLAKADESFRLPDAVTSEADAALRTSPLGRRALGSNKAAIEASVAAANELDGNKTVNVQMACNTEGQTSLTEGFVRYDLVDLERDVVVGHTKTNDSRSLSASIVRVVGADHFEPRLEGMSNNDDEAYETATDEPSESDEDEEKVSWTPWMSPLIFDYKVRHDIRHVELSGANQQTFFFY